VSDARTQKQQAEENSTDQYDGIHWATSDEIIHALIRNVLADNATRRSP
jgi:hypothetical protein